MADPQGPRPPAGPRHVQELAAVVAAIGGAIRGLVRGRGRGPWRVAVTDHSMLPTIRPGDWLLVDPTTDRWPRRGSIVVIREPDSGELAVKRVAARPGDAVRFADGWLRLGDDEAWLLADATEASALAAGSGPPIDSRRYGPVPVANLVGRAWFRYAPLGRIGRLAPAPVGPVGPGGTDIADVSHAAHQHAGDDRPG